MCLCQLYLQTESAYMIIGELGELSITQFRDVSIDISDKFEKMLLTISMSCEFRLQKIIQKEAGSRACEMRKARLPRD